MANMSEEVQASLNGFWDDARLNAVISALIQHYFPLTVRLWFLSRVCTRAALLASSCGMFVLQMLFFHSMHIVLSTRS